MKLDKQINIGGILYDIRLKKTRIETSQAGDEENDGCTNRREKYINMCSDLRDDEFKQVLFHEIGHGVTGEYETDAIDEDENTYTIFMRGLFDTIKRNRLDWMFR